MNILNFVCALLGPKLPATAQTPSAPVRRPIILREDLVLPQDHELIARLEAKKREYGERRDTGRVSLPGGKFAPDPTPNATIFKLTILGFLLGGGTARYKDIEATCGLYCAVDPLEFDGAWRVIRDYVETGGRNLHLGTGLPPAPIPSIPPGHVPGMRT